MRDGYIHNLSSGIPYIDHVPELYELFTVQLEDNGLMARYYMDNIRFNTFHWAVLELEAEPVVHAFVDPEYHWDTEDDVAWEKQSGYVRVALPRKYNDYDFLEDFLRDNGMPMPKKKTDRRRSKPAARYSAKRK